MNSLFCPSFFKWLLLTLLFVPILSRAEEAHDSFPAVQEIFQKHCLDCHEAKDPEANLVLENFESLIKGGESGASVIPGKSADSLLVKMVEGKIERDGKKLIMPPGKSKKLDPAEIALIRAWIDAGAIGSTGSNSVVKELILPKIQPRVSPRKAINAIAFSAPQKLVAIARYGEVELVSAGNFSTVQTLSGHHGNVNGVVFSSDGSQLFSVSGENALFGEVRQWKTSDGSLLRSWQGHRDTIYSAALSPDGKILATGSYDQKVKLWDTETGKELKTLSGHNGAIFGLSFRADGKILASASADRTVKLWDVTTGERRDTLSQSFKEVYTVVFSPDGKKLFAGGVDSRIRIWQISETAVENSNPLLESKFAHEGAILRLVFSADGKSLLSAADDRSLKVWDVGDMKEKLVLEQQPDWCVALAFLADDQKIAIGRLDGSIGIFNSADGKLISPRLTTASDKKF